MRVLIAPDKFKGSLTAAEVADQLGKGLAEAGANTRTLPLADGGDGSVAAALASGFHPLPVSVHGAAGQQHRGLVAFDDGTAIVEVANTCGLSTLPGGVHAPLTASSYGFGEALRAALTLTRRRLVLALGGSASTDGGIGMLAALGYRFLDRAGQRLAPAAENLSLIHTVDSSGAVDVGGIDLIVAGDVTSPLLGLTGAAAVFGPQKGANAAQMARLDAGLNNLVDAFTRSGYHRAAADSRAPGSGARAGRRRPRRHPPRDAYRADPSRVDPRHTFEAVLLDRGDVPAPAFTVSHQHGTVAVLQQAERLQIAYHPSHSSAPSLSSQSGAVGATRSNAGGVGTGYPAASLPLPRPCSNRTFVGSGAGMA